MFFVFVFVCLFSCVFCFGALGTSLGEGQTSDAHSHPIPWVGWGGGAAVSPLLWDRKTLWCLVWDREDGELSLQGLGQVRFCVLQNGLWGGGGFCFFSLSFLLLLHSLWAPVPFPSPCLLHAEAPIWGHFGAFALPQGAGTGLQSVRLPQPASSGAPSKAALLRAAPFRCALFHGRHLH